MFASEAQGMKLSRAKTNLILSAQVAGSKLS
jgi:hypothetical protein